MYCFSHENMSRVRDTLLDINDVEMNEEWQANNGKMYRIVSNNKYIETLECDGRWHIISLTEMLELIRGKIKKVNVDG